MTQKDFDRFLNVSATSNSLSWVGTCAVILFHGMKCGAATHIEMFNFTNKLVPFGYRNDDGIDEPAPSGCSARKKPNLFDKFK